MGQVRSAAVAGIFYPDEPQALRAVLAGHLTHAAHAAHAAAGTAAGAVAAGSGDAAPGRPKLLVVPHAGYIYSGDVAASAFALLAPVADQISRVLLLGPVHRVAVSGLAAPLAEVFETPLGRIAVDQAALARIDDLPQLLRSDRPHALEHSLEVQLPFLQTVLGSDFSLVPLAVGDATPQQVDEVLERLWGGDETLVVISSDLSHFLSYEQARARDQATVRRILNFANDLHGDEACGAMPLNGALITARRHGLRPRLLGLCNSGDTAGDRQRVVGYGAIAFEAAPAQASADGGESSGKTSSKSSSKSSSKCSGESGGENGNAAADGTLGPVLLATARAEIAGALGLAAPAPLAHARLQARGASFVTLHDARGALRGCIGQLEAYRSLGEDVRHNARAAALRDPRFPPLTAAEWPGLQIEVSVLGPLELLPATATLKTAAAGLRPGIDGVLLEWRGRRATFLPQVWAQLPQPRGFLQALLQKAGLSLDFWASDIQLWRYQVTAFEEARNERPH